MFYKICIKLLSSYFNWLSATLLKDALYHPYTLDMNYHVFGKTVTLTITCRLSFRIHDHKTLLRSLTLIICVYKLVAHPMIDTTLAYECDVGCYPKYQSVLRKCLPNFTKYYVNSRFKLNELSLVGWCLVLVFGRIHYGSLTCLWFTSH